MKIELFIIYLGFLKVLISSKIYDAGISVKSAKLFEITMFNWKNKNSVLFLGTPHSIKYLIQLVEHGVTLLEELINKYSSRLSTKSSSPWCVGVNIAIDFRFSEFKWMFSTSHFDLIKTILFNLYVNAIRDIEYQLNNLKIPEGKFYDRFQTKKQNLFRLNNALFKNSLYSNHKGNRVTI